MKKNTQLEEIARITLENKDGKLYYGGYLDLRGTQITDTSKVNRNAPTIYTWRNKKYVKADNIFSEVVSHKGNVYRIKQIGESKERYLVADGNGKWAHGDTLKEAKEDLIYKISNRDKSEYENMNLESVVSFEEAIEMYRVITGSCSLGTRNFVENRLKDRKDKYSISEIISITKGEYQSNAFADFFAKTERRSK